MTDSYQARPIGDRKHCDKTELGDALTINNNKNKSSASAEIGDWV